MRASLFVVVHELAIEAVDALVDVDPAIRVDRLHRADVGAALAGIAAVAVTLEPVEHADAGGDAEGGPERTHVAAEEPLDEKPDHQQPDRERHEGPRADELQDDRGLERLDLGELLTERERIERGPEQN